MDNNFFDDLVTGVDVDKAQELQENAKVKHARLDYLIHRVFEQGDDGKELMALWEDTLIMSAGCEPGWDSIQVGITEGYKRFIRNIKLTVRRVEGG